MNLVSRDVGQLMGGNAGAGRSDHNAPPARTGLPSTGLMLGVGIAVIVVGAALLGCIGAGVMYFKLRGPGPLPPGKVVPVEQRRPLREWICGSWENLGPHAPYLKTDRPIDVKTTLEFRADGGFVSGSTYAASGQRISVLGTWSVKEESPNSIVIHVTTTGGHPQVGTSYRYALQYVNENEFLFVDDLFKERLPATYRRQR